MSWKGVIYPLPLYGMKSEGNTPSNENKKADTHKNLSTIASCEKEQREVEFPSELDLLTVGLFGSEYNPSQGSHGTCL